MQFTESMIFIREDITTHWRDGKVTIKPPLAEGTYEASGVKLW